MGEPLDPQLATMPVTGLVPMIQVRDVQRSVDFYQLLGFAVGNRFPGEGRMNWAWLYAPNAPDWRRGPNLMLSLGQEIPQPVGSEVVLYFYASDLVALRNELERAGKAPGPIQHPFYLPDGEFEIQDPDGYCLMIAQSVADTP
jgi:catechol 2,3-dioxygenase-like lactoylglutathione lyase family enzyme